ncbi:MAG: photosystem I reaction center subunit VIII [Cyanobacteria bacterium J06638_28]
MAASFLPSILVPLVGIVFPAAAMAFLFLYIESDETSSAS